MSKFVAYLAAIALTTALALPTAASAGTRKAQMHRHHHAGMAGHHHGRHHGRHHWAGYGHDCGCNAGWHVPLIARDAPPLPFLLIPGPWWFAS